MKSKTVILVGSGHSHLEVMKAFSKEEILRHRFILMSPHRQTHYSAMIPRFIAGDFAANELTIESAAYAESKGIEFVRAQVQSIDLEQNSVELANGHREYFDILSVNIGGTSVRLSSESPSETIYLRPFDQFLTSWKQVPTASDKSANLRHVVVGGGAAAVEVATALKLRLNRTHVGTNEVHVVSGSSTLCESYGPKVSAAIFESVKALGIQIHLEEPVSKIYHRHLRLRTGRHLEFECIFIVTPTAPTALLVGRVDSTLRLKSHVFAAGDCTSMSEHPDLPRSGVTAVRQGHQLAKNIRAKLAEKPLGPYVPRKNPMNILISGEKTARLVRGSLSFEGPFALRLKNWIDRRYMASFDQGS